jgi:dihydroneopterin aldolase
VTVDTVLKFGGSFLRDPSRFAQAIAAVNALDAAIVLVPGGGPFADAVRRADHRLRFGDDAAHWMAVLAMDQVAHVLVDSLDRAVLVTDKGSMDRAFATGHRPVLAPYRWLRGADGPEDRDALPHSWDVTSDSIAAWVAGRLGARRLVLLKPTEASGDGLRAIVDPYFSHALPAGVTAIAVRPERLADAMTVPAGVV